MARTPDNGSPPRRTIGVDTGGTFTDLVLLEDGSLRTEKISSTPSDPGRAVMQGIEHLGEIDPHSEVVHGTTVALNALVTGRTARTALVTNTGFRDLIEIGRQNRPELYALHPEKPEPLVSRRLRFEVDQRSWPGPDGKLEEVSTPSAADLEALAQRIQRSGAQSLAICLLHSYAQPEIEERVAAGLATLDLPISLSARILPEYREHERFSTAIANAALVPLMSDYLERLGSQLSGARFYVMQSSGGTLLAAQAASEPVRVLFSGPAGGVVGAARAAREAGFSELVALDMGGTSADVAFHSKRASLLDAVTDAHIAGHPVAVPTLDIHTIGCGGGSLVRVDSGGILHVGPQSAGADPGPVCYGRGDELTVTDAHVLLGHIESGPFLAGRLELDVDAVARAFEALAKKLGVTPHEAAQGVLDVARAAMRRAIGVMTMQRGKDPERLPLVAFGGAGGLHGAALAASLDMPGTLVPHMPGVLSAWGMACADALRDHSRSALQPLADWPTERRRELLEELYERGRSELEAAGHDPRAIEAETSLGLRYEGQSYEITLADSDDLASSFHERHRELYGYRLDERAIELVSLRARALVRRTQREPEAVSARALPASALGTERPAWFGERLTARVVERTALEPGHHFEGPALIEEFSGTSLVPPGWRAEVRPGGHLWIAAR